MSEDIVSAIGIGVAVLIYSVFVIRRAIVDNRHYQNTKKRHKGLYDNKVHLGPTDEVIGQIARLLGSVGQHVSIDEVDKMVYDDEHTWVMYAYGQNTESLEGVLIATRVGSKMQIRNYGLVDGVDEPRVRERLARGLAWEARQIGADRAPVFIGHMAGLESQLTTDLRDAYQYYQNEEIVNIN